MHAIKSPLREHILANFSQNDLQELAECEFIITGGSGFVTEWIVSVIHSIVKKGPLPRIRIVTRDVAKSMSRLDGYGNLSAIDWRNMTDEKQFSIKSNLVVIHTSVPAASGEAVRSDRLHSYYANTKLLLDIVTNIASRPIFINVSTGGVYLRPTVGKICENCAPLKEKQLSAYETVKLRDEQLINEYDKLGGIRGVNPRLFSFTGPGLKIPGKFVLSEFLWKALSGHTIKIRGNPNSFRSYMSPVDMGMWIIKSAIRPTMQVLHVGSPQGYSMEEVARSVAHSLNKTVSIEILENNKLAESYVPETTRTMKHLGIVNQLNFSEALTFWIENL